MRKPKVVLIGAASKFFGRQTVMSMVTKPGLCKGTLALVDPDTVKLKWMEKIAKRCIEARNVPLRLEVTMTLGSALKLSILQFWVDGQVEGCSRCVSGLPLSLQPENCVDVACRHDIVHPANPG